ncbi:Protein FAM83G [Liparis tanakae]|uniref:Protein FAM83G n=1 Tax=Liparis tanakae TaxID=230148 RepID=A0A4Z2F6B6_9TELE|nr:Protein FAM83G [Liparis tanakae]
MSSRLDKNLITVITGQAVEAFDRLFCVLYATSSSVDLRPVATEPEPELEPLPAPVPAAAPSAAMARKLYSPKYAMLALSSPVRTADPVEPPSPENSKKDTKKGRRKAAPVQEDPPVHPGVTDLEKVCMMSYLPTWPEPDPPKDVIGFINIRDNRKPNQVHQRSEMFETSQAIRFSSPFSAAKETLPEVATLRQVAAKQGNAEPVKSGEKEATGREPPDSDTTGTTVPQKAEAARTDMPRDSREMTPSARPPTANKAPSSSSASVGSFSENGPVSSSKNGPVGASSPSPSSSVPPLASFSTTPNPPLASSSVCPSSSPPPPPIPKPRTVQLVMKDGVVRKPETSAGVRERSVPGTARKDADSVSGIGGDTQRKQSATSAETMASKEADGRRERADRNKAESDVTITEAPKAASVNIQEMIHANVEPETLTSTDCKSTSQTERVAKAPGRDLYGGEPNESRGSVSECKARAPQRISFSESTPKEAHAVEIVDSVKAPSFTPNPAFQEQIPKAEASMHTPERPRRLNLFDTQAPDSRSPTPDGFLPRTPTPDSRTHTPELSQNIHLFDSQVPNFRSVLPRSPTLDSRSPTPDLRTHTPESPRRLHLGDPPSGSPTGDGVLPRSPTLDSRSPTPDLRSPTPDSRTHTPERPRRLNLFDTQLPDFRSSTPDGFLPRTPTPDSRTHTPDSRTHTPDLRSPDVQTPSSDGYISARTDSALSTNSEEFYECSNSVFHEPVFEAHVGFARTNAPNATSVARGTPDRSTFRSETESWSSLRIAADESVVNGGGEEDRGSVAERDYQEAERRGSEDAKRRADHFRRGEDSTWREEENIDGQAPKRKKVPNQSGAEKPVDAGATPGESTNERAGPKRLSTGDLLSRKSSSERKRGDKAEERAALGPSGAERRDSDGQKLSHALPRTPLGQRRGGEAASPPGPPRPPRPASPARPRLGGGRQPTRTESPPSPRARSRPPASKPDEVAHGRRSPAPRQPPAAKVTARGGAEASRSPAAAAQETHWQEGEGKAPFSFTFSRLYSLKGLRDKVSRLPSQGKGGGANSQRKSTS